MVQAHSGCTQRARLSEGRMAAAVAQLADLLACCVMPEDLAHGSAGAAHRSLEVLPNLSLEQLDAMQSSVERMLAQASGTSAAEGGRPFKQVTVTLPAADLQAEQLGWSSKEDAALQAAAELGGTGTELAQPGAAAPARSIATLANPVLAALLEAHTDAIAEMRRSAASNVCSTLAAAERCIASESAWKACWEQSLQQVAPFHDSSSGAA